MINPDVIYKVDIVSGFSSLDIITLIFSFLSIVISLGAFLNSRKVNNLEIKLKQYTLEQIKKSHEASEKANVIAEIQHFYDFYKIKLYNLGPATAYNVDFELPPEINQQVTKNKTPYEHLCYAESFVEDFAVTLSTPVKFNITVKWEDKNGIPFQNECIVSFQ